MHRNAELFPKGSPIENVAIESWDIELGNFTPLPSNGVVGDVEMARFTFKEQ